LLDCRRLPGIAAQIRNLASERGAIGAKYFVDRHGAAAQRCDGTP
jgi:hypothetical protein